MHARWQFYKKNWKQQKDSGQQQEKPTISYKSSISVSGNRKDKCETLIHAGCVEVEWVGFEETGQINTSVEAVVHISRACAGCARTEVLGERAVKMNKLFFPASKHDRKENSEFVIVPFHIITTGLSWFHMLSFRNSLFLGNI